MWAPPAGPQFGGRCQSQSGAAARHFANQGGAECGSWYAKAQAPGLPRRGGRRPARSVVGQAAVLAAAAAWPLLPPPVLALPPAGGLAYRAPGSAAAKVRLIFTDITLTTGVDALPN